LKQRAFLSSVSQDRHTGCPLGADNEDVYHNLLGLLADEFNAIKRDHVI
jgi:hypothetical protein